MYKTNSELYERTNLPLKKNSGKINRLLRHVPAEWTTN